MKDCTVTVGVDCATQPSAALYCVIEWSVSRPGVEVLRRPDPDWGDLIACLDGAGRNGCFAGLDVPLGWPRSFVQALQCHASGHPWPAGDLSDPHYFRLTDLRVPGRRPLSVSTNLLGATAIKAAMLLRPFVAEGRVDRSGLSGAVCEVYPRAALEAWRLLPAESYKSAGARQIRQTIVQRLVGQLPWIAETPGLAEALSIDDDHLDAFVAALVARLVLAHRGVVPPGPDDLELAREEGWIWVPEADSLSLLATSDTL
ncbi:MAG: DUF429 domain-containing protein [Vicinamibacterales bacterium]